MYQIVIQGHIDDSWQSWFDGLHISRQDNGTTFITGPIADQAALHGYLKKIRNTGITLLSVNIVRQPKPEPLNSKKEKI